MHDTSPTRNFHVTVNEIKCHVIEERLARSSSHMDLLLTAHGPPLRLNRRVINQPIIRVILPLQRLQPLNPPTLMSIPVLDLLVTMRIIHIRIERPRLPLQRHLPQLPPSLDSLLAERGVKVDEHGADEVVIKAIRERGGGCVDRSDAAGRVILEEEEAVAEPGLRGSDGGEFGEEVAVCGGVVGGEADGEAEGVVGAVDAADAGVAVAC